MPMYNEKHKEPISFCWFMHSSTWFVPLTADMVLVLLRKNAVLAIMSELTPPYGEVNVPRMNGGAVFPHFCVRGTFCNSVKSWLSLQMPQESATIMFVISKIHSEVLWSC